MNGNPFDRRENWLHWLVAVLAAIATAALLIVVLTKLGGQSNPPDVERAMEPPPRASADEADEATAPSPTAPAAPPSADASGTIRR
jgi:hypothetical protein